MAKDNDKELSRTERKKAQSKGQKKQPWNNKFGNNENMKNRQYSRTSRNKTAEEASVLSKVILGVIVFVLLSPFVLFYFINAQRSNDEVPSRTTEQVMITRSSEASSESSSEENKEKESSSEQKSESDNESSDSSSESVGSVPIDESTESESRSSTPTTPTTPPTQEPTTPEPTGGTHVVVAGDTWYAISRAYGVDVFALMAANGANEGTPLQPGQSVIIP